MIDFSIIIPHKNIPHLLQRCLNSIPQREDISIFVVDDNSDPSIVDFDTFPGSNNPQCKIIRTFEGKGAGFARNVALNQADSRWILFADCDDFFTDKLSTFLDKYKDSKADVVYFFNETIDNETNLPLSQDKKVEKLIPLCLQKQNYDPLRYLSHNPWCKMVKLSLIREHNIQFQEVKASNDVWFSTLVGYHAKDIKVCEIPIYTRTVRQGSLQYSLNKDALLSRIQVGYKVNRFLKTIGKIEYYNETWGYFCDLRRISWGIFIKTAPSYLLRMPIAAFKKNILHKILE